MLLYEFHKTIAKTKNDRNVNIFDENFYES